MLLASSTALARLKRLGPSRQRRGVTATAMKTSASSSGRKRRRKSESVNSTSEASYYSS